MKYKERIIKHNIVEPDSIVPEHIKMKEVNWMKTISHHVKSIERYVPYGLVVNGVRYAVKEIFERDGCLIGVLSYDEKHFYELKLSFMDDKLIKEIQEDLTKTKTSVENNSNRIDTLEKQIDGSSQTLSIKNRTVSISGGNSIELPEDHDTVYDDTALKKRVSDLESKSDSDNQLLSLSGNDLSISGGNTVQIPSPPPYNDSEILNRISSLENKTDNDKQTLSISNRTISISNGNSIELPNPTLDGGDNLVCNSAFPTDKTGWGLWELDQENPNLSVVKHSLYYNNTQNLFVLKAKHGDSVPASTKRFQVKRNTTYSLNISMFGTSNINKVVIYYLGRRTGESKTFSKGVNVKEIIGSPSTNGFVRYYCTFDTGESDEGFIRIDNGGKSDSAQTSDLYFTELDVYEGTSPRAWQMSTRCIPTSAGKSAYQTWLDLGNTGTEQDFINSLKGAKGDKGDVTDIGTNALVSYTCEITSNILHTTGANNDYKKLTYNKKTQLGTIHLDLLSNSSSPEAHIIGKLPKDAPKPYTLIEVSVPGNHPDGTGQIYVTPEGTIRCNALNKGLRYIVDLVGYYV